jgi:hypothetical protein
VSERENESEKEGNMKETEQKIKREREIWRMVKEVIKGDHNIFLF